MCLLRNFERLQNRSKKQIAETRANCSLTLQEPYGRINTPKTPKYTLFTKHMLLHKDSKFVDRGMEETTSRSRPQWATPGNLGTLLGRS